MIAVREQHTHTVCESTMDVAALGKLRNAMWEPIFESVSREHI